MITRRTWITYALAAALLAGMCIPYAAAAADAAEAVAAEFVSAFQKCDWKRAQSFCSDAALSWVEYVSARDGKTDGITSISKVESSVLGESIRAKVYYVNADGQLRVRYLKIRDIEGRPAVVDDRMMGREWVSLSYRKGLFATPQEIGGVRVTVLGLLEAPPEVKIDLLVENISGPADCMVLPSIEAFYVVDADGAVRQKYYASAPELLPEKPLAKGETMRTYAILPFWSADPAFSGRQWKKITWTLYVPFGPLDQFAFDYM
ncbi:MAG: hypothetical protein VB144_07430 [Clostridia bacterium]|nr:hypothetical protein [Clostridia bacterium]